MKIAIIGSREFKDMEFARQKIGQVYNEFCPKVVISGGAKGIDSLAEGIAKALGFETSIYLPDWNRHGKSAGFRRNQLIINEADKVIAFWDGKSKGTKHSIDLAIEAGKPVDIYVRP